MKQTLLPFHRVARKQVVPATKEYKRLKIGSEVYLPGDTVVVNEYYDSESYATIVRIVGDPHCPNEAKATVRWFYKTSSVFDIVPEFMGLDELFDSDHEDDVYVQTITSKIRVISLKEYMHMEVIPDDVFFSRASFASTANELVPDLDLWTRVCFCRSILSPNDVYRICAKCEGLFHPECCKRPDEEDWKCDRCQ